MAVSRFSYQFFLWISDENKIVPSGSFSYNEDSNMVERIRSSQ